MSAGPDTRIDTSAVHAGERAVQLRAGVHERSALVMQHVFRDFMPEQHIELFEKLPSIVVGGLDAQRRPWASVLVGRPGFVRAPDAQHLHLAALPAADDPLQLQPGMPLGLLGLEPHTRRRNRMNGSLVALDAGGFTVQVDQSFGNCPKYIQARRPEWIERGAVPPAMPEGAVLSEAAQALVRSADTLFIASASAQARAHAGAQGVDVSHRGGRPGFVRVDTADGASVLTLPDFQGNNFFNTLGNLADHPFAGLLFTDPEQGHMLQLTGRAEIVWSGPELQAFAGAQRLLHITVERGVWRPQALPLRWSSAELSPYLGATGHWG